MDENKECQFVRERLFDYVNHELAPDDHERVSEHLKHCRACSLEAEEIAGIANALPEAIPVPVKRIRAGVDNMIRADRKKRLVRRRILRAGSMAAAFCLVAGMAFWYGRFGLKPQAWWNISGNSNLLNWGTKKDNPEDSNRNDYFRDESKTGEEEIQVTVERNECLPASISEKDPGERRTLLVGSDLAGMMQELDIEATECGSMKYYVLETEREKSLLDCLARYQKELLYYEVTDETSLSDNSFIDEDAEEEIRAALEKGFIVILDIGS